MGWLINLPIASLSTFKESFLASDCVVDSPKKSFGFGTQVSGVELPTLKANLISYITTYAYGFSDDEALLEYIKTFENKFNFESLFYLSVKKAVTLPPRG